MNQGMDNSNNQSISPYKATGNLNTIISNPSANINDTMNVNIQNMQNQNYNQTDNLQQINNQQVDVSKQIIQNNLNIENSTKIEKKEDTIEVSNQPEEINTVVEKRYVSTDNKTKKKSISLDIGPEFKMALLIIIILLVFILLLPIVPNMFRD